MLQQIKPYARTKPRYGVKVNKNHPLLKNGGGVWLFNEGTGNIAYDGLGRNNGMLNGGVSWTNGGLKFDVSTGQVDAKLPLPSLTNKATFSFWANTPSNSILQYPVSTGFSNAIRASVFFNNNQIGLFDGSVTSVSSDGVVKINSWLHIVVVYDNSTAQRTTFFVNGTQVAALTNNVSGSFAPQNQVRIGKRMDGSWPFIGNIDNLQILRCALTASQIQQLYANPYLFLLPQIRRNLGLAGISSTGGSSKFLISHRFSTQNLQIDTRASDPQNPVFTNNNQSGGL